MIHAMSIGACEGVNFMDFNACFLGANHGPRTRFSTPSPGRHGRFEGKSSRRGARPVLRSQGREGLAGVNHRSSNRFLSSHTSSAALFASRDARDARALAAAHDRLSTRFHSRNPRLPTPLAAANHRSSTRFLNNNTRPATRLSDSRAAAQLAGANQRPRVRPSPSKVRLAAVNQRAGCFSQAKDPARGDAARGCESAPAREREPG
jgi:hypothetical protein